MKSGEKTSRNRSEAYRIIPDELIDMPDDNDRFDIPLATLQELTESIIEIGLLEPILVNKSGERFTVIAGKRRLLASRKAGAKKIKCIVKEVDQKTAAIMRAAENLQRVDLSPIEEGMTFARLYDHEGFTVKMIAKKMGKSEYHVTRKMSLLKMDEEVQKAVHEGKISEGVGLELSKIEDKKELYRYLYIAVENGVTTQIAKLWTEDLRKALQYIGGETGQGEGLPDEEKIIKQYATCDTCAGPVEYKDTQFLRICGACYRVIQAAVNDGIFNK